MRTRWFSGHVHLLQGLENAPCVNCFKGDGAPWARLDQRESHSPPSWITCKNVGEGHLAEYTESLDGRWRAACRYPARGDRVPSAFASRRRARFGAASRGCPFAKTPETQMFGIPRWHPSRTCAAS